MDFSMEKSFDGSCWKVKFSGEIDIYNSADVKSKLVDLMGENVADVHIDCENLEYIDSTGLGSLVGALKHVKSHDKEMRLYNVGANILKLFRITSLDKVFVVEASQN